MGVLLHKFHSAAAARASREEKNCPIYKGAASMCACVCTLNEN